MLSWHVFSPQIHVITMPDTLKRKSFISTVCGVYGCIKEWRCLIYLCLRWEVPGTGMKFIKSGFKNPVISPSAYFKAHIRSVWIIYYTFRKATRQETNKEAERSQNHTKSFLSRKMEETLTRKYVTRKVFVLLDVLFLFSRKKLKLWYPHDVCECVPLSVVMPPISGDIFTKLCMNIMLLKIFSPS